MFRTLGMVSPVAMFGADVMSVPPDGPGAASPAGGGADAPIGDAGGDAGDVGGDEGDLGEGEAGHDAGDREAGEREDDLEDLLVDEDDDQPGQTRTPEESLTRLKARNRKLRRQLARNLGTLKRVKGLDLDQVLTKASQYDSFEQAARSNPKLRALLGGGNDDDAEGDAGGRRGRGDEIPEFDETKLPFNANENPINRYFADIAKKAHVLEHRLQQLVGRLDGNDRRDVQRSETTVKQQWTEAIRTVDKHIKDPKIARLVRDAMVGAYNSPAVRGKYTAQQILSHYLKEHGANPAQAARATAAARQRMAEGNKTRPAHPQNGGVPAGPRSGKSERLGDVRRRLAQAVR